MKIQGLGSPIRCFLLLFITSMFASCGLESSSRVSDQVIRAAAEAEKVLHGVAQFYANELKMSPTGAYAIKVESIGAIGDLVLEEGFRRVASAMPSEDSVDWIFRFSEAASYSLDGSDVMDLWISVVDLNAASCCYLVGVHMKKTELGWRFVTAYRGGFATETREFREERTKRAEKLK